MKDRTSDRKVQHIDIIGADRDVDRQKGFFDGIRLTHRALPELDLKQVDPSTTFMGKRLSFPLLISCMTGGDHDLIRRINMNLAMAAEATRVAMGVGSQRVMITNPDARSSFELRRHAPTALLFANLGAVQLNHGFGLAECRDAVDVLRADALCLHLNPLQESVQPEGDTNFAGLAAKIGSIAKKLKKPIILKEVGAGISPADAKLAIKHGIRYLDVAGSGGTSWSRIEHHRQDRHDLGIAFQDWGIPTPQALLDLAPFRRKVELIASGGVRSGMDMAKCVILGASLCGVASPLLKPAMKSVDAVIAAIEGLKREFVTTMFLLGIPSVKKLTGNRSLILNT